MVLWNEVKDGFYRNRRPELEPFTCDMNGALFEFQNFTAAGLTIPTKCLWVQAD